MDRLLCLPALSLPPSCTRLPGIQKIAWTRARSPARTHSERWGGNWLFCRRIRRNRALALRWTQAVGRRARAATALESAGSIRSRDPRARRAVLCRRGRAPTGLSQALRAAGGHRSNRGRVAPRSPRSEVRPHPVAQPRRHLQACVAHPVPPSAAGSVCSGIGDRSSRPGLSTLNCGGLCAETHNNIFWHLERSQQTPLHGMLPSECSLCVNPSNDLLWRTPMTSAGRQPM